MVRDNSLYETGGIVVWDVMSYVTILVAVNTALHSTPIKYSTPLRNEILLPQKWNTCSLPVYEINSLYKIIA